jgi:hypothetical protein
MRISRTTEQAMVKGVTASSKWSHRGRACHFGICNGSQAHPINRFKVGSGQMGVISHVGKHLTDRRKVFGFFRFIHPGTIEAVTGQPMQLLAGKRG